MIKEIFEIENINVHPLRQRNREEKK